MIPADEALKRLKEGNARYVSGVTSYDGYSFKKRRKELVGGQSPIAVVLGCSDARVPAELVFDLGLGDLFVVRVAGNIAAPSQIGSIEYAVEVLGTRLVVVLGHSNCGAVQATIQNFQNTAVEMTSSLMSLIDRIQPSVDRVLREQGSKSPDLLVDEVVKANVINSVETLRRESSVLIEHESESGLLIVGAEYCLEKGNVEFFENRS